MQSDKQFQEDLMRLPSPNRSAPSTPNNYTKKNAVQLPKSHFKLSPPSSKKTPKSQKESHLSSLEEKTLVSEEVRIKGQEKLTYLRQSRFKKLTPEQIFDNYPFSNMQVFTFNHEVLRDDHNHFTASIVQNEKGIHLVQQFISNKDEKYVNVQEEESNFNGLSVSLFHNGSIFQGMYHNDKCCGLGYELQPNGNTYIGSFKEGLKNGQGTFYWFTNNEVYAGEWQGGLPHGTGTYLGKDKYEGNFLNGLKFGFGEENFYNGDKYIGQYVNSVADGYGQYFWTDKSVYKGDFKQGVRHGYGIWQDENEVYKGYYRLDKKEGLGIYTWKGKQVYKGEFRDDFRQGYGQFFSLVKGHEKLKYRGCWLKGKKNQDGKVEEQVVQQLHSFLEKNQQFENVVEKKSGRKTEEKKKACGHKNCIPKQSYPSKFRT